MFSADDGRQHSALILRCEREEASRREDRADMLSFARRHGLSVRWEHSGFPGSELVPRLYRAGDIPVEWPPLARR